MLRGSWREADKIFADEPLLLKVDDVALDLVQDLSSGEAGGRDNLVHGNLRTHPGVAAGAVACLSDVA